MLTDAFRTSVSFVAEAVCNAVYAAKANSISTPTITVITIFFMQAPFAVIMSSPIASLARRWGMGISSDDVLANFAENDLVLQLFGCDDVCQHVVRLFRHQAVVITDLSFI